MTRILFRFSLLACLLVGMSLTSQAQFEDLIKNKINESLQTYLVKVSPGPNCECNACVYNYDNSMKIESTRKVGGILQVFGKAKIRYTSKYSGAGMKVVEYYAEVRRVDVGQFEVGKLRWKAGRCMPYQTLMEK